MVTTVEDRDCPEPWLKKKKEVPATRRETRSAKAVPGKEAADDLKALNLPAGSGRGRRKNKPKVLDTGKGKLKSKPMPAAIVDAVLGGAQNPVPDVEELRRKNEDDARACGRLTRTVSNPGTPEVYPTTTCTAPNENDNNYMRPPQPSKVPSSLANISTVPESRGMRVIH